VISDSAVSLWARYVEREGALVETDGPASALTVLPPDLQARHGLPEVVTVTGDPDAAREDGSVLLAPGHPLLEGVADRVLHQGDVGVVWIPFPVRLPDRKALEGHARESFPVDHGRIDAADVPHPVYLPVLRAAALVTYEVSLDARFQERCEVWVDATNGRALPERTVDRLRPHLDPGAQRAPRSALAPDLPAAIRSVGALIDSAARLRLAALEAQAAGARDAELARAATYYDAAFESIQRRKAASSGDRAALLEVQAETTRVERERRLAEIRDKFRPRHSLRPFRAHLVQVPAVRLPVEVRRGPRVYPWQLVWILAAGAFRPESCPSCGAEATLVAGRSSLGCRACLA
jgi:hypothetical protein